MINVFDTGGMSQQTINFLSVGMMNRTTVEQKQAGANIAGNLFNLPGGPLGVALGVEYREESAFFSPDNLYRTSEAVARSAGLKPAGGEYDVSEVFGEVRVPIVSDLPFAYYLGIEAGARYSDYSTAGGVNSFKYGGEWAPIRDLRFRGLIQRAVRAPNVIELFRGGDNTAPQARDFCDITANPTPAEKAFCVSSACRRMPSTPSSRRARRSARSSAAIRTWRRRPPTPGPSASSISPRSCRT